MRYRTKGRELLTHYCLLRINSLFNSKCKTALGANNKLHLYLLFLLGRGQHNPFSSPSRQAGETTIIITNKKYPIYIYTNKCIHWSLRFVLGLHSGPPQVGLDTARQIATVPVRLPLSRRRCRSPWYNFYSLEIHIVSVSFSFLFNFSYQTFSNVLLKFSLPHVFELPQIHDERFLLEEVGLT